MGSDWKCYRVMYDDVVNLPTRVFAACSQPKSPEQGFPPQWAESSDSLFSCT
jgi:hypothetical protein